MNTGVVAIIQPLTQSSKRKYGVKALPGNGRITADIPDIHLPKQLQLVLMEFDWGSLSFVRRSDTTVVGVESVTIKFKSVPQSPFEALAKLNLPAVNPQKDRTGYFKWKELPAGKKTLDLRISPNLTTAKLYFCPCSESVEEMDEPTKSSPK